MACDQLAVDISDNRKMVSFSRTFTFKLNIQVNRTNQIVRTRRSCLFVNKYLFKFDVKPKRQNRILFSSLIV